MVTYSNGQGSVILRVKLRSSAVATGAGLTGLTSATAGLVIGTIADNEATTTKYRASSSEVESIATLGTYAAPTAGKCRFKEVDATNHPGLYEIQIADARLAVSNAKSAIVSISGAANLVETDLLIALQAVNPYDGVRGGMTALPNAAAGANGGLPLGDASGRVDVGKVLGTAQTAGDLAALLATVTAYVDTEVAAIKSKTDNLPSDPADASDIAAAFASLASTLSTIASYIDTEVSAIKAKTDNLPAAPAAVGDVPTAAQNAAALMDLSSGVETGLTPRQALRLMVAAMAGKLSGAATTTVIIRNAVADSKDRITATVDSDGNRSAVTVDLT